MRMQMKKCIAVLLTIVMCLSMVPANVFAEEGSSGSVEAASEEVIAQDDDEIVDEVPDSDSSSEDEILIEDGAEQPEEIIDASSDTDLSDGIDIEYGEEDFSTEEEDIVIETITESLYTDVAWARNESISKHAFIMMPDDVKNILAEKDVTMFLNLAKDDTDYSVLTEREDIVTTIVKSYIFEAVTPNGKIMKDVPTEDKNVAVYMPVETSLFKTDDNRDNVETVFSIDDRILTKEEVAGLKLYQIKDGEARSIEFTVEPMDADTPDEVYAVFVADMTGVYVFVQEEDVDIKIEDISDPETGSDEEPIISEDSDEFPTASLLEDIDSLLEGSEDSGDEIELITEEESVTDETEETSADSKDVSKDEETEGSTETEQTTEQTEEETDDSEDISETEDESVDVEDIAGSVDLTPDADYVSSEIANDESVEGADVQGVAAENEKIAALTLEKTGDLSARRAKLVTDNMFSAEDEGEEVEDIPRQLDGSNIEGFSIKWITADTVDDGDPLNLYLKPTGTEKQQVRMQINYALSGEHNYDVGDIVITIPSHIFKTRDGKDYGNMIIPYPENPSTKGDFNWTLKGDTYVLTNTKRMSAATKGYIQFAITDLDPRYIVDMETTAPFNGYIEVATYKGNTIAAKTDDLTVQIDTEAKITSASKRPYGSVEWVDASAIPESQRVEGEEQYVRVNWYMWGYTTSNTKHTIKINDTMPDEYDGFIINASSDDGLTYEAQIYDGYGPSSGSGTTSYYYYSTAYPGSQFEPDVLYTFHNNVTFTLTETDPDVYDGDALIDEQKVTVQTAAGQTSWSYSLPEWHDPTGHFNVFKNGNDDTDKNNQTRYYTTSVVSDTHLGSRSPANGYYGIYPSALNEIQDGEDIRLSYTINSVGYIMPWTYDPVEPVDEMSARLISNYFKKAVKMTTEDTGISLARNGSDLVLSDDYTYNSVEFVNDPWIYTGVPHNINPDGSWTALTAGDGTFKYSRDNDKSHWPDITLEIKRNDVWEPWAVCSWSDGSMKVTLNDGTVQTSGIVFVPNDTENVRTVVTSTNAAVDYDIRVVVDIKNNEKIQAVADKLFELSNTPRTSVWNGTVMTAEMAETGEQIVVLDKDGYDSIRGYTTDTKAVPAKYASQSIRDVDYEDRVVTIHYSAQVEEQSIINDQKTYLQAIEDGRLVAETGGTWYDLLPKGVTPVVSTVRLRNNDTIKDVRTIENYKNTGRTLLIVSADLKVSPVRYQLGDMYYWEDVPKISFDAIYDFESLKDYGYDIHNVIAFESDNEIIGTIEHYTGEPDDPLYDNNISTVHAFIDDAEKATMTDLDSERDDAAFVYAGVNTHIDIISAARTSLQKDVMVNNDGDWGDGVWNEQGTWDPENHTWTEDESKHAENLAERAEKEKVVYEGGQYSYRLRMMSDDHTISKDLILYDSLENFYAQYNTDGTNQHSEIDIDAARWQGKFRSIDVSQLEDMGAAPVVYYSTVSGLLLSDETDPEKGHKQNMNLSNSKVWIRADLYEGDPANVKAIAVDASKRPDGTDFQLEPLESAVVVVRMLAPSGDEASEYIAKDAHAYNNAYLLCTSIDKNTMEADSDNFVRKDYTKVGLMENSLMVTKVWDDDNNRDGVRPETVVLHLLADGKEMDPVKTVTLNGEVDDTEPVAWTGLFAHIPYTDPDGNKIQYSVTEETVAGYTSDIKKLDDNKIQITNTHEPERISVSGQKIWNGDEEDVTSRPGSIQLTLFANGKRDKAMTVYPNLDGDWEYNFDDLYKYEDGAEIEYTVEETVTGKIASYIPSYEETDDGINVINTYHPYGELSVSKILYGASGDTALTSFPMTFVFTKTADGEEAPVFTEYEYDILDESGEVISSGTIKTNESISIQNGQTIHVKELDEGIHYSVTEAELAGFTQEDATNVAGTIQPNKMSESVFVNRYAAKGQINLQAEKTLLNRSINKYQFRFELYEVTTDENGDETEQLIRTASNDKADVVTARKDDNEEEIEDTIESSHAVVTFGALRYTEEDAGNTYTYKVVETNTGKAGYVYDESVFYIDVTIEDNGDGTLDISTVYRKAADAEEDDEGSDPVDDAEIPDEDDNILEKVEFVNDYKAEGEIALRAWKDLHGRSLTDGEFSFELLDEEGNVVETMTNTEDGSIVFSALKFTEEDVGQTYYYGIREVTGTDPTVNYDDSIYGYSISILDNGDGTLSFSQGFATPVTEDVPCLVCEGVNSGFTSDLIQDEDGSEDSVLTAVFEDAFNDYLDHYVESTGKSYISISDEFVANLSVELPMPGTDSVALTAFNTMLRESGYEQQAGQDDILYMIWKAEDAADAIDGISIIQLKYACSDCDGMGTSIGITGWNTDEGELPVFVNTLKPGSLSVSKFVEDAENADPNQEFTFRVQLIGPDIEDGEYEYELQQAVPDNSSTVTYHSVSRDGRSGTFDGSATTNKVVYESYEDETYVTQYRAISGTILEPYLNDGSGDGFLRWVDENGNFDYRDGFGIDMDFYPVYGVSVSE